MLRWHAGRGRKAISAARRGSGELVCRGESFIKCCVATSAHTHHRNARPSSMLIAWCGGVRRPLSGGQIAKALAGGSFEVVTPTPAR